MKNTKKVTKTKAKTKATENELKLLCLWLLEQAFWVALATVGLLLTVAIVNVFVEFGVNNFEFGSMITTAIFFFFYAEFRLRKEVREGTLIVLFAYFGWAIERRNIMAKVILVILPILGAIAIYGNNISNMIHSDKALGYGIVMIGFTLIVFGILREAYKAVVDNSPMKYNQN